MTLRSHDDGSSSSKRKAISDENDYGVGTSLGSDLDVPSDGSISDDDGVPKRRKNTSVKSGSQCSEKAEEEDGERCTDADVQNVIGIEPGKIEFTDGIAEKSGSKKIDDRPLLKWELLQQENNRWIEENFRIDWDLISQDEILMETVEPSDDLMIELKRYQKEWLAWALKQEESTDRGGILADEMGMGKTLQAIALVLSKRSILKGIPEPQIPSSSASSSRELPPIKATLVICPAVAVSHWCQEIDRFTSKGSTKVLVYHGANRAKKLDQLSDYDFVITTYSTLGGEFRKYMMPPKAKCPYCGSLLYNARDMKMHLQFGYMICCNERKNSGSGGKEMENDCSTDSSDLTGLTSSEGKSILHCVDWERIVLDEAHCIKQMRSNTTRAVLALQSRYKWALSGNPLQNRVGELYVLIRFLQIHPYSYYFCMNCNCSRLDYSPLSECPGCGHRNYQHFCWWERYVSRPIQKYARTWDGRGAMLLLKHKILKSFMLRRTKRGRIADLELPPSTVTLRRDSLDADEEDYYIALYNASQAHFNTYVETGTLMDNYTHMFDLLTRLRQAVIHPYLVEYSLTSMGRKGKAPVTNKDLKCVWCNEPDEDAVVTLCRHAFCIPCWVDFTHSPSVELNACPYCLKPLTSDFITNKDGKEQRSKTTIKGFRPSSILNRIQLDKFQTSTKIDALREEIRFMVERDGSAKAIVFSQFPPFLDLIHYALQKSGVQCVQLDGSMSMGARDTAIKKFTEDPSCIIFLMSLKAGGVALNITVASHVFLMDPWWNPAVERQVGDRIYRIGQHKPIRIVMFIIKNSIEERILKLQQKKTLMLEHAVAGSSEPSERATREFDLRFLFVP